MKKCVAFSAFYSHFLVYSLAAKKKNSWPSNETNEMSYILKKNPMNR